MIGTVKPEHVKQFNAKFLKELVGARKIGIELEFPVVNQRTFRAMDSRPLFNRLIGLDDGWMPFAGDKDSVGCIKDGVAITTDSGICTLEMSSPPQANLYLAKDLVERVLRKIVPELKAMDGLMLGYGIQPLTLANNSLWKTAGRTKAFRINFPDSTNNSTITAAAQTHVEATSEEFIMAANVFNAMAPLIVAIFANSPVWKGSFDLLARRTVRESLWKDWNQCGRRTGVLQFFKDTEDYLRYLYSLTFLATTDQTGRYFAPSQSFGSWVSQHAKSKQRFMECVLQQEGFVWSCARPRARYGTVEIRPACAQPPGSEMIFPAFCLGVMESLKSVSNLVNLYRWKDWNDLYEKAILKGFDAQVKGLSLQSVAQEVLSLAYEGLENRYTGEEILLSDAFTRLYKCEAPAERVMDWMGRGGIEEVIKRVAY